MRHLEAKQLWVQEKTRSGLAQAVKIQSTVSRGDQLTKFLDPERHWELVGALPLSVPSARRSASALAVATVLTLLPVGAEAQDDEETASAGYFPWLVAVFFVALGWIGSMAWGKKEVMRETRSTQTDMAAQVSVAAMTSTMLSDSGRSTSAATIFVAPRYGEKFHFTRARGGLSSAREVREFSRCKICG